MSKKGAGEFIKDAEDFLEVAREEFQTDAKKITFLSHRLTNMFICIE